MRGNGKIQSDRERRINIARRVLREQLLPHVGLKEGDQFKKAFFTGYMVNRLITAFLNRATEDDRDYYGKKRLDMAGPLLCNVFRQEFRKVITDMQNHIKKDINN
jgi:DNA-directed RNA polymerase II subunit RPB2